jgi:hypothetical protein
MFGNKMKKSYRTIRTEIPHERSCCSSKALIPEIGSDHSERSGKTTFFIDASTFNRMPVNVQKKWLKAQLRFKGKRAKWTDRDTPEGMAAQCQ